MNECLETTVLNCNMLFRRYNSVEILFLVLVCITSWAQARAPTQGIDDEAMEERQSGINLGGYDHSNMLRKLHLLFRHITCLITYGNSKNIFSIEFQYTPENTPPKLRLAPFPS